MTIRTFLTWINRMYRIRMAGTLVWAGPHPVHPVHPCKKSS
jgi:hypothetical protein